MANRITVKWSVDCKQFECEQSCQCVTVVMSFMYIIWVIIVKWMHIGRQVWYFISKIQPDLPEHSNPFKCSPGSHSQKISCSVGITSSCSLLASPLLVSLASTLPLLLIRVATPVLHSNCKAAVNSTQVRSHGSNIMFIAHADTQTTSGQTDVGNIKQS